MSLGTWIRARRKFCCLKRVAKRTDFVRCEGLGGTEPISQMSKMMIERLHRDAVSKTPTAIYYHQHETEKKKNRRLTTLFKTTTLNWASNTNYTLLFAMSIMKNYLSERQNHSFMSHKKALFQTLQELKRTTSLPGFTPTRPYGAWENLGTRLQKRSENHLHFCSSARPFVLTLFSYISVRFWAVIIYLSLSLVAGPTCALIDFW